MDKQTFSRLLARCMEDKATAPEKELLAEYLKRLEAKGNQEQWPEPDMQAQWQQMQERIHRKQRVQYMPRWWQAAAAVILLAIPSWWLWHTSNTARLPEASYASQQEIPPGTNQAQLTLANGTTVALSNNANLNVASQGGATVSMPDSGQLTYTNTSGNISKPADYNTLATPKGGQFQLTLSDGTQVWLNAGSSIRYPTVFIGNTRKVEVTGETYFEIAANAQQPFIITTHGMDVKVLGTELNINAYTHEQFIRTTLISGSIKVNNALQQEVFLKPGQQAIAANESKGNITTPLLVRNVNIEQVTAWKNGFFAFENATLQEVMQQIAMWYNVDIIYQGQLPDIRFNGEIQRSLMLSQVLRNLQKEGIRFNMQNQTITVAPQ